MCELFHLGPALMIFPHFDLGWLLWPPVLTHLVSIRSAELQVTLTSVLSDSLIHTAKFSSVRYPFFCIQIVSMKLSDIDRIKRLCGFYKSNSN